jgi:hypothetical protein
MFENCILILTECIDLILPLIGIRITMDLIRSMLFQG